MTTVTVIVPVHDAAAHLCAAMDSLAGQTFTGWKALCVDDGSTDGSGAILDGYAAKDPRVTVVHQANAGASAARNAGLDRAGDGIVAFMDADDVAGPDWLARLVAGIDGVDFAWGGGVVDEKGAAHDAFPPDVGAEYSGDALRRRVWRSVFGYRRRDLFRAILPGGLWRNCRRELGGVYWRAFRRSVIGGLRFDTRLKLCEDAMFLAAYATRARTMRVIGDTGYRYSIRDAGAMMTQARAKAVEHWFALRDARKAIDPQMRQWKGSYWLSAFRVLKATRSLRETRRFLRFG